MPNPIERKQMRANTERMLSMIDSAVAGAAPFLPVKLIVFPEFAHSAPVFETAKELIEKLAIEIPNEHTERLQQKAREHDIYIQSGSMLEVDPKWPGHVFNATCLIGPEGILYKYRKVNTWIPYEAHTSPHDLADYDEPLFPVADTPIGKLGCAICYDWLFPEAMRQLAANGAEVLIRVSAYMDPWGATPPMDWWTVVNRCRALENLAYVVAANQGASAKHYPPFSWPGGSMIVDYDGRILSQADPGLNTRAGGTLLTANQVDTYPLTLTPALGSGRLTAEVRVVTPPLDCMTKMLDFPARDPGKRCTRWASFSKYLCITGCKYALITTVLVRSYSRNSGRI